MRTSHRNAAAILCAAQLGGVGFAAMAQGLPPINQPAVSLLQAGLPPTGLPAAPSAESSLTTILGHPATVVTSIDGTATSVALGNGISLAITGNSADGLGSSSFASLGAPVYSGVGLRLDGTGPGYPGDRWSVTPDVPSTSRVGGKMSMDLGRGLSLDLIGGVSKTSGNGWYMGPRGLSYLTPTGQVSSDVGAGMSLDLGGGSSLSIAGGVGRGPAGGLYMGSCGGAAAPFCR